MIMKTLFVALLFLSAASVVLAAPTVEIKPSKERTSLSSFDEDHLDLILKENGSIKDTHYFYSSYGSADAQVIQDRRGSYYVLLTHREGRGTHVRSNFMTVFKVRKKLNQVATFPIDGPAGPKSDWKYSCILNKPVGGGLEFRLSLKINGGDAIAFPEDKSRTISIK